MNTQQISLAKTLTTVGFLGWVGFTGIELLLPSAVMRLFSPHWFLIAFILGSIWWYNARRIS